MEPPLCPVVPHLKRVKEPAGVPIIVRGYGLLGIVHKIRKGNGNAIPVPLVSGSGPAGSGLARGSSRFLPRLRLQGFRHHCNGLKLRLQGRFPRAPDRILIGTISLYGLLLSQILYPAPFGRAIGRGRVGRGCTGRNLFKNRPSGSSGGGGRFPGFTFRGVRKAPPPAQGAPGILRHRHYASSFLQLCILLIGKRVGIGCPGRRPQRLREGCLV